MSTLREAAQQALDALYDIDATGVPVGHIDAVIDSLKAALAQEEQEPVAWIQPDHLQKARQAPFLCRVEPTKRMSDFVAIYTHPPRRETKQEDITPAELSAALGWPGGISTPVLDKGELLRMVAAHPPRREWQSLTDEEMLQCLKWNEALELFNEHRVPAELIEEGKQEGLGKGRAIEQACKERNT